MILNEANNVVDLDKAQPGVEVNYCVLDFQKNKTTSPEDGPDYYWRSLVWLETYHAPSALLQIGEFEVLVPFRWSIMTWHLDQAELITVEELIGRDYVAFCINPISSFFPESLPIRFKGVCDSAWTTPPLSKTELLVTPIGASKQRQRELKPLCVLVGERTKVPDTVDPALLW